MSWETFYFGCFLIGLFTSVLTLMAGVSHVHLPKGFHAASHGPAAPTGHGGSHGAKVPWFNIGTLTAFLAWFGGTGYLLTRYSSLLALAGLALAIVSGCAGAAVVFWFLFQLQSRERDLDPRDYEMIGVLGQVSSGIREGGTGEMLFSQGGTRRSAPIRSENSKPIPKGAEVVVMRYERGIAYVRSWDEVNGSEDSLSR